MLLLLEGLMLVCELRTLVPRVLHMWLLRHHILLLARRKRHVAWTWVEATLVIVLVVVLVVVVSLVISLVGILIGWIELIVALILEVVLLRVVVLVL